MTIRKQAVIVFAALLGLCVGTTFAQMRVIVDGQNGRPIVVGGSPWGFGGVNMQFEQFIGTVTQLNMTPDFTLDKTAKQKLQDIRDEFAKAQAKFREDNKDELKKLSQEQMEAFQTGDQEKIKEAGKKYQEFMAKGPKGEEYVARAKALLTPEQAKLVEEKIQKAEEDRKAMMEKWRQKMDKGGGKAEPGL